MSLTLTDLGVLVAMLLGLLVPFGVYLRASMSAAFIPREALETRFLAEAKALELQAEINTAQHNTIVVALESLKHEVRKVQSPPEVDRLQAALLSYEQREKSVEKRLAHIESLLERMPTGEHL